MLTTLVKIALVLGLAASLTLGILCFLQPEKVGKYILRRSITEPEKSLPLPETVKAGESILLLRFVGVLSLLSFVVLVLFTMKYGL